MKTPLLLPALLVFVLPLLTACSSPSPEPRPGTINISTGGFGPNVQIGGLDHDDATPASVRIH